MYSIMSTKLYQSVIQQMKDCTDRVIGVIDESATIIACNDLSMIGQSVANSLSDIMAMSDVSVMDGYTYRVIGSRIKLDNVVFVKGTDALAESLSGVLAVSLNSMKIFTMKNTTSLILSRILFLKIFYRAIFMPKARNCTLTARFPAWLF